MVYTESDFSEQMKQIHLQKQLNFVNSVEFSWFSSFQRANTWETVGLKDDYQDFTPVEPAQI